MSMSSSTLHKPDLYREHFVRVECETFGGTGNFGGIAV